MPHRINTFNVFQFVFSDPGAKSDPQLSCLVKTYDIIPSNKNQ